jgi:regulatory protein
MVNTNSQTTKNSHEDEGQDFTAAFAKAEKIALRLIARAEQTSFGLAVKLKKRGIEPAVAEEVISQLLEKKLLDDERFAELFIRSRIGRKGITPRRLLIALGKRGRGSESSLNAISKIMDQETELFLLLKFLGKMNTSDKKEIRFLRAQLKYEDFSSEILDKFFS